MKSRARTKNGRGRAAIQVQPTPADLANLEADLRQLEELLAGGEIEAARRLIRELEHAWPGFNRVRHFVRVVAPPEVAVAAGGEGRRFDREHAWLREHACAYPRQWLAVLGDDLLSADPDVGVVMKAVRAAPLANRPLLHFEPVSAVRSGRPQPGVAA